MSSCTVPGLDEKVPAPDVHGDAQHDRRRLDAALLVIASGDMTESEPGKIVIQLALYAGWLI